MEDDVVFHEDTDQHLANSIKELPPDWELFYLGANIIGRSAIPYSEHLVKTNAAWTTHAVGISRAGARQILEAGFTIDSGMLDDQLAKRIHGRGRTFIAKPMLAVQRPGYSDLWGRKTDYADIWRINLDKISKA
jgi:GR25 family glycosyltransferase involved in LPS biosynthesis